MIFLNTNKLLKRMLIILFSFASLAVSAKSMREIWLSMPDSMVRYLNKSKRIEFLDYVDMKVKTDVTNLLQGSSVMDTITSNYLSVKLNEVSVIQMRLLPVSGSDSLLCVVRTYSAPAAESTVNFFTQDWQLVGSMSFDSKQLIAKPDTMSEQRFTELRAMIEPVMVQAELSADRDELFLQLSMPLLNSEDKKAVGSIISQIKLKWNGETFK